MEKNPGSRKKTVSAGSGSKRRLPRTCASNDSSERERDEKSKHEKDRDRQSSKRTRKDRSDKKNKEKEVSNSSEGEYDEAEEGGRNQRGIRTARSSPAVVRGTSDEVLAAVIPRRARSRMVKRVRAELISESGEDSGRRRSSPAVGSVSSVGGDDSAPSAEKMKSSVEPQKTALEFLSGSNVKPSSALEALELEVVEILFDLHQSHSQTIDTEKTAAADNDEMNISGKGESVKEKTDALSLEKEQAVQASAETVVAGSDARDNPEPTLTTAKHVATVVQTAAEKLDDDCYEIDSATFSRSDKHVVDTAANPNVAVVNMTTDPKRSSTTHKDAPAGIQLQKENETAAYSNQSRSSGMGKSLYDFSSINTQQQNLMGHWNQSAFSFLPLSSGMHGWSGVIPYQSSYTPPPLQAPCSSRSSAGMNPPFSFSEPWGKRCATHQFIARNICRHQQMVDSVKRGPHDGSRISDASLHGVQPLDGKHLSLSSQNPNSGNKPWVGTNQGVQILGNITSPSENEKNAAYTHSKSSHAPGLHMNQHQTPSGSFSHGPGFVFPFVSHQAMGITPELSLPGSSESHAALSGSPSAKPPLKHRQQFPAFPIFNPSMFNFPPSLQHLSCQPLESNPSSSSLHHKQPPAQSSKQPMQLSTTTNPNTEYSLVQQYTRGLVPFPLDSPSIPPQMTMMSDQVEYVSPDKLPFPWGSSSPGPSSSSVLNPSMQWHQQQLLLHQLQMKQMAQDQATSSSNVASNKRQVSENVSPSTAGVFVPYQSQQSGSALPAKETTEAAASQSGSTQKTSPSCRRDMPSLLGNGQINMLD